MSRSVAVLETVPALEIKAVLNGKKNKDWNVYSTESGKRSTERQFRVIIAARMVKGLRSKTFHVGFYESKTEADDVVVLVEELLETLVPYAAITHIQMVGEST